MVNVRGPVASILKLHKKGRVNFLLEIRFIFDEGLVQVPLKVR